MRIQTIIQMNNSSNDSSSTRYWEGRVGTGKVKLERLKVGTREVGSMLGKI